MQARLYRQHPHPKNHPRQRLVPPLDLLPHRWLHDHGAWCCAPCSSSTIPPSSGSSCCCWRHGRWLLSPTPPSHPAQPSRRRFSYRAADPYHAGNPADHPRRFLRFPLRHHGHAGSPAFYAACRRRADRFNGAADLYRPGRSERRPSRPVAVPHFHQASVPSWGSTSTPPAAPAIEQEQQALVGELQEANRRLEALCPPAGATGRRARAPAPGRELHDSVTQTIFSMTLTTQSALLLLDRDPPQVAAQLDRLDQLAQSALAEMQVLDLQPGARDSHRRRIRQRPAAAPGRTPPAGQPGREPGSGRRPAARPGRRSRPVPHRPGGAQQHRQACRRLAGSRSGCILPSRSGWRSRTRAPVSTRSRSRACGRVGLAGMRERAAEIGWTLQVGSSPGARHPHPGGKNPGRREQA